MDRAAVIFGINGQDGHYLKQILVENGVKVIGVSRSPGNWIQGNVADFRFVNEIIKEYKPEFVFHFAANSSIRHDVLFENHQTICTGSLNILEAVYLNSSDSKVFLSGSALQFQNNEFPIDEQTPFSALSPYAVSRIQSVYAGRYYRTLGINVYIGYFFHHDSPLRSEQHINQYIVKTINRISKGASIKLKIGDICVKKEFNFSGDLMRAVWIFISQEKWNEAVIGCGKAHSIGDWIDLCFKMKGINQWKDNVIENDQYDSVYKVLVSNPSRLLEMGWKPEYDISGLATMMLNYE